VVIRKFSVKYVRLLAHPEDNEDQEGQAVKSSPPLFVIFVPFAVVRALIGLNA